MQPFYNLRSEAWDLSIPLVDRGWASRRLENWFESEFPFHSRFISITASDEPGVSSEDYAALAAAAGEIARAAHTEEPAEAATEFAVIDAPEVFAEPALSHGYFTRMPSVVSQETAALDAGHSWAVTASDVPAVQAMELMRSFGAWRFDDVIGLAGTTGALRFALGFDLPGSVEAGAEPVQSLGGGEAGDGAGEGGDHSNGEMPALLESVLESEVPALAQAFAKDGDPASSSIADPSAPVGDADVAVAALADGSLEKGIADWLNNPGAEWGVLDDHAFASALSAIQGDAGPAAVDGAGLPASGVVFDIADLLSGASPDGAALGYLDIAWSQAVIDQSSVHVGSMNEHEMAASVMAIHDAAHRISILAV